MSDVLKYEPMSQSKIDTILEAYKHEQVLDYIKELWGLISYQKEIINEQRMEIIAFRHKKAWQHYDRKEDNI